MTTMAPRPPNPLSSADPWTWVAEGYLDTTRLLLEQFAEPAILSAQLNPKHAVVDVAAGPGTVACNVAPRVCSVRALDFSPAMVEKCRARAAALGLTNLVAEVGDGQALPYPSDRFDVGFSMFGLMFFPDRMAGFRELLRVLRPGGKAFVSSWAPVDQSPLMSAMMDALRAADPSRPAPQRDVSSLENPDLFQEEMRAAGFIDVTIEPVFRDLEYSSLDQLCDGMIRGSAPIELLRRRLGEPEWKRQEQIMREHLKATLGPFPRRLGSTAWLGIGKKPEL